MNNKAPLVYLGSPYSHPDPEVVESRVRCITAITAELTLIFGKRAIFYSPIVHSHQLERCIFQSELHKEHANPKPDWIDIDKEMLKYVTLVCFVKIKGWEESEGMKAEKAFCDKHDIPYVYASWNIARVIEASVLGKVGKDAEVPELARVELSSKLIDGESGIKEMIYDANG